MATKTSNYWERREQNAKTALFNKSKKEIEKELAKEYKETAEKVRLLMSDLYYDLATNKRGYVLISDLYKYNRYYDLINSINKELLALGQKEVKICNKAFITMYEANAKIIDKSLNITYTPDKKAAERVIHTVWTDDGKSWSSRIWKNNAALVERLETGLFETMSSGFSKDKLVKSVKDSFNTRFYEADRLVRTELSHIQNQSTLDRYKKAGIEQYEFLAELDERNCKICGSLNGKQFNIKDIEVGVNYPPMHANCRCTTIPVLNHKK